MQIKTDIRKVTTRVICICLLGSMAGTAQADIVIRDVTDPATVVWTLGGGDIQYIDSVCIGVTPQSPVYDVTATGTGSGGSFFLQGPLPSATDTLSYTVQWSNKAGQTTGTALTAGQPRNTSMGNAKLDLNCNPGGMNATVIVTIPQTDLTNAPNGDYSGTLFLEVAPK